ncbi:MAG: hypothetical protein R3Y06_05485 [Faecalibacterium sp.]
MKKDNALTSIALLATYWNEKSMDSLTILSNFIKYAVGKNFLVDDVIDVDVVLKALKEDFAFEDFPYNMLEHILENCREKEYGSFLGRKKVGYFLSKDISAFVADFEKDRLAQQSELEQIAKALLQYEDRCEDASALEHAKEELFAFLDYNGLMLMKNPAKLDLIQRKSSVSMYTVAQFILEEEQKNSVVFAYINKVAMGSMLASAIYIDNTPRKYKEVRLEGVVFYLDTAFLLNALGYKTERQERSALELLSLLYKNDAQIACFEENVQEVTDILFAYKCRKQSGADECFGMTLEKFDELDIEAYQIQLIIDSIKEKIEALGGYGITIRTMPLVDTREDDSVASDKKYMDYTGFVEHLQAEMKGYKSGNTKKLENDVKAIYSINFFRNGEVYDRLFDSCAIFVTTNKKLAYQANCFLSLNVKNIPIAIDDVKLTVLLWLSYASYNKEVLKDKLIEYANAALHPSHDFIEKFYETISKLEELNIVSPTELRLLRTRLFLEKMCDSVKNDQNRVNEESAKSVLKEFEETCRKEPNDKIKVLEQQLARQKKEDAKCAKQQMENAVEEERTRNIRKQREALKKEAEEKAKRCADVVSKIALIGLYVALVAVVITSGKSVINQSNAILKVCAGVTAVMSVSGVVGVIQKNRSVKAKIYDKVRKYVYARKHDELFRIFEVEDL